MNKQFTIALVSLLFVCLALVVSRKDTASPPASEPKAMTEPQPVTEPMAEPSPEEPRRRGEVELPGLKINVEGQYVDIEAEICLDEGGLELIACTRDTKEHESLVTVAALPMHIHTALLLLDLESGSPAMRVPTNEEQTEWTFLPPYGQMVEVFLVLKDEQGEAQEFPISDFITQAERVYAVAPEPQEQVEVREFPNAFVFAGSIIHDAGEGRSAYSADHSGHVISICTYGDELLCLPEIMFPSYQNIMWMIDTATIPKVGTKVTLRLRAKRKEESGLPE